MQLHLKYRRSDARGGEKVAQTLAAHVAHTDVARQPSVGQRLHRAPRLAHGDARELHARAERRIRVVDPLRRVPRLERHKRERDRKVNEVKVDVRKAEVGEGACHRRGNMLRSVIRVPLKY